MSGPDKKPPAAGGSRGLTKARHPNSTEAQRHRLGAALQQSPVSTIYARKGLDILAPAARVFELRARGWRIDTVWIECATECGRKHRVALYVWRGMAGQGSTGSGDNSGGGT